MKSLPFMLAIGSLVGVAAFAERPAPLSAGSFLIGTGAKEAGSAEVALKVVEERKRRVATPELNRWLRTNLGKREPPTHKGKRLKVLYVTQAEATTPTFVFFVNDPELVDLHLSIAKAIPYHGAEGVSANAAHEMRGRAAGDGCDRLVGSLAAERDERLMTDDRFAR